MSSEIIVSAPPPAALSKKERKRARKMGSYHSSERLEGTLQPAVQSRLIERGVTAGAIKMYLKPEMEKIDADDKLTDAEKDAAKKKVALQAFVVGLVGEQMLAGNFGRAATGVSSAGAAMLGFLY